MRVKGSNRSIRSDRSDPDEDYSEKLPVLIRVDKRTRRRVSRTAVVADRQTPDAGGPNSGRLVLFWDELEEEYRSRYQDPSEPTDKH